MVKVKNFIYIAILPLSLLALVTVVALADRHVAETVAEQWMQSTACNKELREVRLKVLKTPIGNSRLDYYYWYFDQTKRLTIPTIKTEDGELYVFGQNCLVEELSQEGLFYAFKQRVNLLSGAYPHPFSKKVLNLQPGDSILVKTRGNVVESISIIE